MSIEREVLWSPSENRSTNTMLAKYKSWLSSEHSLCFDNYQELWEWSVDDIEFFWETIWDFFDVKASKLYSKVLAKKEMPGTVWFPGSELNYVDQLLRQKEITPYKIAVVSQSETFGRVELTWTELYQQVASVADQFRKVGLERGDRVVAILPNSTTALIAFLATASLGGIWSLCAPDMGHVAVLDRFKQIKPKILIAQDGYIYGGKKIDRKEITYTIMENLPTLEQTIILPVGDDLPKGVLNWKNLINNVVDLETEQVPFDHPLWVVYSSGTTGNPKPIVHGHGGVLLVAAAQSLNMDLTSQDRFSWLTSSGWIMWNAQWIALSRGATVVMFDFAPNFPDMLEVWRRVDKERLTYFGAGAAFFLSCLKAGIEPINTVNLDDLISVGSTGSPLSSAGYKWIYKSVKADVWLAPISGGTDLAAAFVMGNPMDVVRDGEMQARALGIDVHAFNEKGQKIIDEVGELVCTKPIPSMPLYFWGDYDNKRLISSYYDTYPGVWRHGDWIEFTPKGGSVIYGRSDATINRKGLRLGSSEIYQAVEALGEVQDSLVVDLEFLGKKSFMILFVVLTSKKFLNDTVTNTINESIRSGVSARFIPNQIVQIEEVPRTMSGKKLEVPIKRLLLGNDPSEVVNIDSMANPKSFDWFKTFADTYLSKRNEESNNL